MAITGQQCYKIISLTPAEKARLKASKPETLIVIDTKLR